MFSKTFFKNSRFLYFYHVLDHLPRNEITHFTVLCCCRTINKIIFINQNLNNKRKKFNLIDFEKYKIDKTVQ